MPSSVIARAVDKSTGSDWDADVSALIATAETIGNVAEREIQKLRELLERSRAGRFHLAVLGQFKRGKSSVLNALLGEALLPCGVAPVTAIPTLISAGAGYRVSVHYSSGAVDLRPTSSLEEASGLLRELITESGNPGNRRGIQRVEVTSPCPTLAGGVVLIDTPGIGSTFRHNSLATFAFLPECDAAVFVVSTDPPITETEISFLKEVLKTVSRVFFVMNKADYLDEEERREAVSFLRRALCDEARLDASTPVFLVSAREGSRARSDGDEAGLEHSGIAGLQAHITQFLAREKDQALKQALSVKVTDKVRDILTNVALTITSARLPLTELESRLAAFNAYVQGAERERQLIRDGLEGDRRRVLEFFEGYCRTLRASARETFSREAASLLVATGGTRDVTTAIGAMLPDFFAHEMEEAIHVVERRVQEAVQGHAERTTVLRDGIREAAFRIFEIEPPARRSTALLEIRREPFWVTRPWDTVMSPLPDSLVDALLPAAVRARRVRTRVASKLEELLRRNVENLRWAVLQSIRDATGKITAELDADLESEICSIRGAIDEVMRRKADCEGGIEEEVRRLEGVQAGLTADLQRFESRPADAATAARPERASA
jgi:ribosome biogenesis GTPase A